MKRYGVKWIRDKCKSAYQKGPECEVCGTTENLEFHHYYSMAELFNSWVLKKKLKITTDEDILEHRDDFIEEHRNYIYDETVTLCKAHHERLHKVYGKSPRLVTGPKQKAWVEKQRCKHSETS